MSAKPQEFADRVLTAFAEAGRFTDAEVGAAGGPSTTYMTKLRAVRDSDESMTMPRNDTFRKIDEAANWEPGSARRVWAGDEPVGRDRHADTYVPSPGERVIPGVSNDEVLRRLDDMQRRLDELSERLADPGKQSP